MYQIISIEREYSSLGNDIGRILAKELGYKLLDHSVLVQASKKLNLPAAYIMDLEETAPGSIIFNLAKNTKAKEPLSDQLFNAEKEIIQDTAKESSCVVIGRCGGEIFDEETKVLKVFIRADKEIRTGNAMKAKKFTRQQAEAELKKSDKRRRDFYNTHTGKTWGAPENFDLVLDSGKLGVDACVAILKLLNEQAG